MKTFIDLFKQHHIPRDGFFYPSAFPVIVLELTLKLSNEEIKSL